MRDLQLEIQRIHNELIEQALVDYANEKFISVTFTKKELEELAEFLNTFAYD